MKKTQLENDLFYYGDYLELIGKISVYKQLTLKDLGNTADDKAVIQKCYRDIRKEKFKGTVIDYLCWISYRYLVNIWQKEINAFKKSSFFLSAGEHVKKFWVDPEIVDDPHGKIEAFNLREKHLVTMKVAFLSLCKENETHSRNMIRLFNRNPLLIIESEGNDYMNLPKRGFILETFDFFILIMILNCYEFLKENIVNKNSAISLWEHMLPSAIAMIISKQNLYSEPYK